MGMRGHGFQTSGVDYFFHIYDYRMYRIGKYADGHHIGELIPLHPSVLVSLLKEGNERFLQSSLDE